MVEADRVRAVAVPVTDHRQRAARPCRTKVALEAAHVEVARQGHDDEDCVDVGRQHLHVDALAGGVADERRASLEDGGDAGTGPRLIVGGGLQRHPVADRRQIASIGRGTEQAGDDRRQALAVGRADHVGPERRRQDATRHAALSGMWREGLRAAGIPAPSREVVIGEVHHPTRFSLPVRLA